MPGASPLFFSTHGPKTGDCTVNSLAAGYYFTPMRAKDHLHAPSSPSRAASNNGAGPKAVGMPAVQRIPDWLQAIVRMAEENPITAAATITVGAASVLAYYYWKRQPKVPSTVQAQLLPPDWNTLVGLARTVNVAPDVLRAQLENGVGDLTINALYKKGFDPASETATGLVPPSLLADLPESAAEKVETLFQRLNQFRFNYTGIYESGGSSFLSGNGDCLSLAERFLLATRAAGVAGVTLDHDEEPMLVVQHAIHGRNTLANLDGSPGWFFFDHHWGVYNGTRYDLLFMNHQTPQATHRTQENVLHNGVRYDVFGDMAVIHAGQFDTLTLPLTPGRVGRSMPVAEVQGFIDTHRRG